MTNPLEEHQKDYKPNAWDHYTIQELGNWVHLFEKRSHHRNNIGKATKDLHDAKNYLWMIEEKLRVSAKALFIEFENL